MIDQDTQPAASIEIVVFGALTEAAGARSIQVRVALPCTAMTLRSVIDAAFVARWGRDSGDHLSALLASSALADETHVFSQDELIIAGTRGLALLPPVCGG